MYRGSTPTFTFNLPCDVSVISKLYITFADKQDNIVLEKTLSDCTTDGSKVMLRLSQEETLQFEERKNVRMQLRALTVGGDSLVSPIRTILAGEILKEGVI